MMSGDTARLLARAGYKTKASISKYIADHIHAHIDSLEKWYLHGEESKERLNRLGPQYATGKDVVGIPPESITILRVGSHAGKDDFYRGMGGHTVNIADWK